MNQRNSPKYNGPPFILLFVYESNMLSIYNLGINHKNVVNYLNLLRDSSPNVKNLSLLYHCPDGFLL